jgi:magnesium transporter
MAELHLTRPVTESMHRDFTRIGLGQTVGQALAGFRDNPPGSRIIYFYVLDEDGRLRGVVPTRRLLLSKPETPVADIMVREAIAIPAAATLLDACEFFTLHRLLAFPVVDEERRMLGVVDVELYAKELGDLDDRERHDDLFQLIGVHLSLAQQTSSVAAFRSRFPWLLCNIAAGVLAALLAGLYENELKRVVELALFIPVVLALSESVSIQSVTLTLQVLRGQPTSWRNLLQKLRMELLTGALLGVSAGALVGLVAAIWLGKGVLAVCIVASIAAGVAASALLGLAMPIILRLLHREPQVAAGPIALAAADMVTLLVYFNLARWLL